MGLLCVPLATQNMFSFLAVVSRGSLNYSPEDEAMRSEAPPDRLKGGECVYIIDLDDAADETW